MIINFKTILAVLLTAVLPLFLSSCEKDNANEPSSEACSSVPLTISFASHITNFSVHDLRMTFLKNGKTEMLLSDGVLMIHDSGTPFFLTEYTNGCISGDTNSPSVLSDVPFHDIDEIRVEYALHVTGSPIVDRQITKGYDVKGFLDILTHENVKNLTFIITPSGDSSYKDGVFTISSEMREMEFGVTIDPWNDRGQYDVILE